MVCNSKSQHLSCSQHHPCDSASRWPMKLWRCPSSSWEIAASKGSGISHCTPVCSEAWGVKANSSPSFPHPMFSAQCHWTCLSLQTSSSRKSSREKGEKAGTTFVPCSSCSVCCNSAFKAQRNPCHQQKPTAGSHLTETWGTCKLRASIWRGLTVQGEGVYGTWKKIRTSSVRNHLAYRIEKGGEM